MGYAIRFLTSLSLLIGLTACQIYKSNGRSLFESAANPPSNSVGNSNFPVLGHHQENETNCWTQPSNEALWFVRPHQTYQVTSVEDPNSSNIEVCFKEEQPDQEKEVTP